MARDWVRLPRRLAGRVLRKLGLRKPLPPASPAPVAHPTKEYRTIELDYPVRPRSRWGHGVHPRHPQLLEILDRPRERYRTHLERLLEHRDAILRIPREPSDARAPSWFNGALPAVDVMALYSFTRDTLPTTYLEVGSGMSTKITRRAFDDANHRGRIVSIDPHPRVEIDQLCDEAIRMPVEDVPLETFDQLGAGDILFYDGSHRCLQNNDVTVMLLDVLPRLAPGVLMHIHDILLPDDYEDTWSTRFYSEQYVLAAYLLGGHERFEIELANWFCRFDPELYAILEPMWAEPHLAGVDSFGSSFWLRTR